MFSTPEIFVVVLYSRVVVLKIENVMFDKFVPEIVWLVHVKFVMFWFVKELLLGEFEVVDVCPIVIVKLFAVNVLLFRS